MAALKGATQSIHDEVSEQNRMLGGMVRSMPVIRACCCTVGLATSLSSDVFGPSWPLYSASICLSLLFIVPRLLSNHFKDGLSYRAWVTFGPSFVAFFFTLSPSSICMSLLYHRSPMTLTARVA